MSPFDSIISSFWGRCTRLKRRLYLVTKAAVCSGDTIVKRERLCPHILVCFGCLRCSVIVYSCFYNKSQQDALFINFILVKNSTCFGQTYCPSSGVLILYSQQLVFVILSDSEVGMDNKSVRNMSSSLPKWRREIVHFFGFFYKNILRCTVVWMSKNVYILLVWLNDGIFVLNPVSTEQDTFWNLYVDKWRHSRVLWITKFLHIRVSPRCDTLPVRSGFVYNIF